MSSTSPFSAINILSLLATYEDPARTSGRMAGMTLVGILVIWGTWKCAVLMRRSTTSALCVAPLFFFSLSCVITGALVLLQGHVGFLTITITQAACCLLLLVGVILGIVGLCLYNKGRFAQGRKQAGWGIVLGTGSLVLRAIMLFHFFTSPAAAPFLAEKNDAPQNASGLQVVEIDEANCKVTIPSDNWTQIKDPKSINPAATLILRKTQPQMLAIFIAEPLAMKTESLASLVKANMEASRKDAVFSKEKKEVLNGSSWMYFNAHIKPAWPRPAETIHCWVTSLSGHSYQWIISSLTKDSDEALRAGTEIVSKFGILHENNSASVTADLVDARFETDGFKTKLTKEGWLVWKNSEAVAGASAFSAMHPSASFLLADTAQLWSKDIDLDDIGKCFFANYDVLQGKYEEVKKEKTTVRGADDAVAFSHTCEVLGKNYIYKGVVARSGSCAFFALSWRINNGGNDTGPLTSALGTIELPQNQETLPAPRADGLAKKRSLFLHELGLHYSERADWPKALEAFRLSYKISQYNDLTLQSIVVSLKETGDIQGAKEVLEKYSDHVKQKPDLRVSLAGVKLTLGDKTGAMADFESAFKDGCRKEDALLQYLTLLVDEKKTDDAEKTVGAFLEKASSPKVRRWQAEVYAAGSKAKRAMEIYEDILAKPPFDPLAAYGLGETANEEGEYDRASAAVASLLKAGNDTARTRMIEGWSHFGKKSWLDAKVAFEKARKLAPDDANVTTALTRVSAMLGEGNNSLVKTPIEPVPLPATLTEALENIEKNAKPQTGSSAYYLSRVSAFYFEPGKRTKSTIRRRARILDRNGVNDFSTLVFRFDPLSEHIYVNKVTVADENGKMISEGKPDEQYVVDLSAEASEATHDKVLRVVVPGLKVGCTVEIVVTKEGQTAEKEFYFETCTCASFIPSLAEAVVIKGDVSKIRAVASESMQSLAKVTEDKNTRVWILKEPPVWKYESYLPTAEDYLPILRIGPVKSDWAQEGRDYLKQIDSLLKPDSKTRAIAAEIVGKLKSEEEKIRALTAYVQKNITYQAIEFGRRARIPKSAERVITSRYGDCKDQALLLYQLLKAVDIQAHLALVNTSSNVEPQLPSLDQFNHMIVRVPGMKAGFLDATNASLPACKLPPELFHHRALVLDPAKPHLEELPERTLFPSESISSEREVVFDANGTATVKEKLRINGYTASVWRNWAASVQPSERTSSIQQMHNNSRWRVEDFAAEGLDENADELVFNLRYSLPPAASEDSAKLTNVSVPSVWESEYLDAPFLKERRFPMEFIHPVHIQSSTTIKLPRQPSETTLKSFARTGDSEFGKWKLTAQALTDSGKQIKISFDFQSLGGNYPAARYTDWQSSRGKVMEALRQKLKLD